MDKARILCECVEWSWSSVQVSVWLASFSSLNENYSNVKNALTKTLTHPSMVVLVEDQD